MSDLDDALVRAAGDDERQDPRYNPPDEGEEQDGDPTDPHLIISEIISTSSDKNKIKYHTEQ
jgi:hypothetical protein